jgi:hypothetical protein
MFIVLNKTTQKTRTPQEENSAGKDKELLCSQMYFSVNDGNAKALK